jgi:hypothetical protein
MKLESGYWTFVHGLSSTRPQGTPRAAESRESALTGLLPRLFDRLGLPTEPQTPDRSRRPTDPTVEQHSSSGRAAPAACSRPPSGPEAAVVRFVEHLRRRIRLEAARNRLPDRSHACYGPLGRPCSSAGASGTPKLLTTRLLWEAIPTRRRCQGAYSRPRPHAAHPGTTHQELDADYFGHRLTLSPPRFRHDVDEHFLGRGLS